MKQIDLNKSTDLEKLKNEMVSIFESKIESAKINETVKGLSSLPTQTLFNIFKHTSGSLLESKKGTKVIAKYVKTIKENEALRKAFCLCENINSTKYVKNVEQYLSESVNLLSSLSKKQLNEGKNAIAKILQESIKIAKLTNDELNAIINENKSINESIEFFMGAKKTAKNLREHVNSLSVLSEYVEGRMEEKEEDEEPVSLDSAVSEISKEINENLEPWEAAVLKDTILADLSKEDMETLFEEYKNRCLSRMEETLNENSSIETISKINTMKEQLQSKSYSKNTINEDLLMLAKLNYMLS